MPRRIASMLILGEKSDSLSGCGAGVSSYNAALSRKEVQRMARAAQLGQEAPPAEIRGPALRRAMMLATVAWMFGSVWLNTTAGTPLANYAHSLGASELQKGILAALPFIATLLSLPASLLIERTGKRKKIFLWGLYFQRLMWFPIALLPWWMVRQYGDAVLPQAMLLFLVLIFIMHTGQAIGGPAWVSWMADLVPEKVRGVYFGRRRQWGILPAVPAALGVGWLLDRYGDAGGETMMLWCAGIFMVSAVFGIIDIALFHYVPDIPREPRPGAHVLTAWREPLRNRQFLWFAGFVATLVFAVSFMGQFVTFYIIEHLGTTEGGGRGSLNMITQMMVIVVPAMAQLLLFSAWGRAVDKMGKKPVMILAGLGLVPVGLGWCLVTRETIWLGYALSAAGAALWAGVEVANFNVVLQWSGSGDDETNGAKGGTGYTAINSVIINIAGFAGGLSAGILAQWLRDIDWKWVTEFKTFTFYDVLFALSGVMRLLAVVAFVPKIHEPAAAPTRLTLRFMTANIYNNLQTAALQPIRWLRNRESYIDR
jgi:MFS family permease